MIPFIPDDVFLIVGLGNPGSEYHGTRHNFGFAAVDFLLEEIGFSGSFTFIEEIQSEIVAGSLADRPICLLKPWTFMNRSGTAVRALFEQQKNINPRQIIVIHDDLDLDLGRIKLKQGGGTGGHNGIKSLVEEIGRADFMRIRLGIAGESRATADNTVSFVLNRFTADELQVVNQVKQRLYLGLAKLLTSGLPAAMNQLNCRIVSGDVT